MNFINFAIDLGTTNSLISKNEGGQVKIFKNPKGFKEALPSVVAFRKNGILVGEKAKEFRDRDPKNVFSSFKRKMGTDDTYWVEQNSQTISPIELSTFVLNELKTFIIDETPQSVVITIPASFDTIQSNATKEAGKEAGFQEVVLLQEPIAACLAVFNQPDSKKEGKWLIYDLGGGTFDVALVEVTEETLKVIDHEGNNFLGGLDFDIEIVKKLIVPQLTNQGNFTQVVEKILTNSDAQDILPTFNYLLFQAEQLKIELTSYPESYVDFVLTDDDGETQDVEIKITRTEFNQLIDQPLNITIQLVRTLLEKNQLSPFDFNEIILVGGSTYSPYVKEKIEKELGIKVNQQADPTNAIALGAAYYAGNKETRVNQSATTTQNTQSQFRISPIYESQSRELSELVILKSSLPENLYYFRVVRKDLGYDSGKLPLTENVRIKVPLKEKMVNYFEVEIYDQKGDCIEKNAALFNITQGLFVIDGQPLPHDICLEVDDLEANETKLEVIFKKNDILPLQKTIYRTVSRNLLTSNTEDELIINILEGSRAASPSTNQIIGCISIKPAEIGQNIIKDSEIGIVLSVSESRDLTVTASISTIDFEVRNIFNPSSKSVNASKLREELRFLTFKTSQMKDEALDREDYERANQFHVIHENALEAIKKAGEFGDIPADTKYHIDEWKRQLYVKYDSLTRDNKLIETIEHYRNAKSHVEHLMKETGFSDSLKERFVTIASKEQDAIQSGSLSLIKDLTKQYENVAWEYRRTNTDHLKSMYTNYKIYLSIDGYSDQKKAEKIIAMADNTLYRENVSPMEFYSIFGELYHLLKPEHKRSDNENEGFNMKGTGLQ